MQTLNLFSTDLLSEESSPFKSLADVTVGDVVCAMVQETRSVSVETTGGSSVSVHSRVPDSTFEQEIQNEEPRSVFITNENVESQVIVIY